MRATRRVGTPSTSAAEPGGDELLLGLDGRHQDLAAHVAALLGRRQLILEVHGGHAGLDHGLHELVSVEHAAKAGLGVGHDGRVPGLDLGVAFHGVDLIRAHEGVVDAAGEHGHAVARIQALVGIGLAGEVHVTGHLPAAEVDGLEAGLHHLHGLGAGLRAERVHVPLGVQELPQPLRAHASQGVLDQDGAAQGLHLLGRVGTLASGPPRVVTPLVLEILNCLLVRHDSPSSFTVRLLDGGVRTYWSRARPLAGRARLVGG